MSILDKWEGICPTCGEVVVNNKCFDCGQINQVNQYTVFEKGEHSRDVFLLEPKENV